MSWRALAAASIGLVAGSIPNYINNLFSPYLIKEFGWSKSEFALIGLVAIISVIGLPIAGRVADKVGLRRIATIGVIAQPLIFAALATMGGNFMWFFVLSLLQNLTISCLAGIVIYTRLIARSFTLARGLAFGLISCAPALIAMMGTPLLSALVEAQGWRAGYWCLVLGTAVCGVIALLLIPRGYDDRAPAKPVETISPGKKSGYVAILTSPAFLIIFAATILCNIHFNLQTTQLKLIAIERGMDAATSSLMISIFAAGTIAGRLGCGFALDRFPPYLVSALAFGIPGLGLAVLAANIPGDYVIGAAVFGLGMSLGAEGDLLAYLATRYFRKEDFSSVLGLFTTAMAVGAISGALLLSHTLKVTGNYNLFLTITTFTILAGSLSFLALGRLTPNRLEEHSAS